ncbi:MAG: hypothetical protein ACLPX7_23395 [Xanthobacteraceae bacterium]
MIETATDDKNNHQTLVDDRQSGAITKRKAKLLDNSQPAVHENVGAAQDNMSNTLGVGAGMGLRLWRGAELIVNYEAVAPPKPSAEPDSQTARLTILQLC